MYDLEYLKEYFKKDYFAVNQLGAKIIEANNDNAKCEIDVTANHLNAEGIIMGGAIFTLADFTFAVATNQHEEYFTVSTTANINYLRPGSGKKIYAVTNKIRDGKTICFYDVNVYNDKDILIAKVNISGTHVLK